MTLDVMAHSLVYWAQELVGRGLMGGAAGLRHDVGRRGPCAPLLRPRVGGQGRAGVEYPAARRGARQPGHHRQLDPGRGHRDPRAPRRFPTTRILAKAAERNPHRRLTTVEDVAQAIVVFSHPDTYWMTGNVIGVDGGEEIVG